MHEDNMNLQALSAATATPATTPDQQSMSGLTGDSFLTLLTAQLKSQDPTAPQDPTAFVGQLVQFNSLEQLLQIRDLLQKSLGTSTGSGSSPSANAAQPITA
jgi:flagellar basal-body rod modification protein FlgD